MLRLRGNNSSYVDRDRYRYEITVEILKHMGCNQSALPTSRNRFPNVTRALKNAPASTISKSDEVRHLEEVHAQLQSKNKEQQNLLRFKIEVLVNMLAVEEKKNQALMERYEMLKDELFAQGVDEDKLTGLFRDAVKSIGGTNLSLKANDQEQVYHTIDRARSDLSAAIAHVQDEFNLYKTDIITALADEQGRFEPTLLHLDFMKRLYMATDHISRDDIEIIALRFSDGQGSVLVPEFIDFFTSPVHVRMARSAASAARMSLDMLVLDREAFFADEDLLLNSDGSGGDSIVQTHLTNYLDSAASKLVSVWPYVEKDMLEHYRDHFESAPITDDDRTTTGLLPCDVFKSFVLDFCGEKTKSKLLEANRSNAAATLATSNTAQQVGQLSPLDISDVDLIAERFDVSGLINFHHFFQYFTQLYHYQRVMNMRRKEQGLKSIQHSHGLSPFRISSEWKSLMKDSAIKQYSNKHEDAVIAASLLPAADPSLSQKPLKPPKGLKEIDDHVDGGSEDKAVAGSKQTDAVELQKAASDTKPATGPPNNVAPVALQSSAMCWSVNKKKSTTEVMPPSVKAPTSSEAKLSSKEVTATATADAKPIDGVRDSDEAKPSPITVVESDAKSSKSAILEGSKDDDLDSTANVKRKVDFEEAPTVKKYKDYDEAVSESKQSAPKSIRSEVDNEPAKLDAESISDIDNMIGAPKSSVSPMKKASAFRKPKQSSLPIALVEDSLLEQKVGGADRAVIVQLDDGEEEEEVPTRWKK